MCDTLECPLIFCFYLKSLSEDIQHLFADDQTQECGTPGLELLSRALRDQRNSFMDQLDLILKWVSLRLCEKENVRAMGQVRLNALSK